jgi:chromosomal replication initiator protein
MTNSLNGLWTEICNNVRLHVTPDAFQRWFSQTSLIEAGEKSLTILVPNLIHQLWIESNYASTLQDSIVCTLGDRRQVRFHVDVAGVRGEVGSGEGVVAGATSAGAERPRPDAVIEEAGPAGIDGQARGVGILGHARGESGTAGFNPSYQFENFVVGANNQFAHAAALAVAENPARIYNPLFLHGGVGLGKTHLMQAIGHHILKQRKRARVIYLSSEQFTNEFIDAIQQGTLTKFRRRYRQADVLLIDDVQFFAGKERSQ